MFALAAGCGANRNQGDEPAELDHGSLDPRPLSGETLYTDTILGVVGNMAVLGDRLVVVDVLGDSAIHVIRRADGEPLHRFGRRGRGPGEFYGPWSVDPVPGRDDAFWVFDVSLARVTLVELASDGVVKASGDVFINLSAGADITDVAWIGPDLIAAGFFAEGRLERFDAEGNSIGTFGEVPETNGDYPAAVRQQAYQGSMRPDPSRTRLAVGARHTDQIEVYAADGALLKQIRGPFGFEPRFGVSLRQGRAYMAPEPDTRFGYVDVTATDERIYALFSGRTHAFGRDAPYGRYLHVYDWDGELHRVLELDRLTLGIVVDPPGEYLYSTVQEPEPAVRVYSLPGR